MHSYNVQLKKVSIIIHSLSLTRDNRSLSASPPYPALLSREYVGACRYHRASISRASEIPRNGVPSRFCRCSYRDDDLSRTIVPVWSDYLCNYVRRVRRAVRLICRRRRDRRVTSRVRVSNASRKRVTFTLSRIIATTLYVYVYIVCLLFPAEEAEAGIKLRSSTFRCECTVSAVRSKCRAFFQFGEPGSSLLALSLHFDSQRGTYLQSFPLFFLLTPRNRGGEEKRAAAPF